jgi:hypothetical protein
VLFVSGITTLRYVIEESPINAKASNSTRPYLVRHTALLPSVAADDHVPIKDGSPGIPLFPIHLRKQLPPKMQNATP